MLSRRDLGLGAAAGPISRRQVDATPTHSTLELASVVAGRREKIAPHYLAVRVGGYQAVGDGGGALYRRAAAQPGRQGQFQSADGAWWILEEDPVTPQMFGARADGLADDGPALAAALASGSDVYVLGRLRLGSDPGLIQYQRLFGGGYATDTGVAARSELIRDFAGPLQVGDQGRLIDVEIVASADAPGDNIQIVGTRAVLQRVTSTGAARDGFRIGVDNDDRRNGNFWRLENCIALKAGRHGMFVHHPRRSDRAFAPNFNGGLSLGFDARECGGAGVRIETVTDCTFIGDGVQNNAGVGFELAAGAIGHKIVGLYAEANRGGNGLPGDEVTIALGATQNMVLGLRSGQLSGAGLKDWNPPGTNAVDVYDAGIGCFARRGNLTVYDDREEAAPYLSFVSGPDQPVTAELVSQNDGASGGKAIFRTKRSGDVLADAWSVDSQQTFITHRGQAERGWVHTVPESGAYVQIPPGVRGVDLEPKQALDKLTVVLPPEPEDGRVVGITTTARIASLSLDAGRIPVRNGSGALPAGGGLVTSVPARPGRVVPPGVDQRRRSVSASGKTYFRS